MRRGIFLTVPYGLPRVNMYVTQYPFQRASARIAYRAMRKGGLSASDARDHTVLLLTAGGILVERDRR